MSNPVLVEVFRGETVESRHRGGVGQNAGHMSCPKEIAGHTGLRKRPVTTGCFMLVGHVFALVTSPTLLTNS